MTAFDPGYFLPPFQTLCESYPDDSIYPAKDFRIEWGPIFHRGRLDGSARILIIGQDPAQHETIARRILIGEAGRRVQGFLAKLGIDRSYVMINTFLYSVYGGVPAKIRRNPGLVEYRNKWIEALIVGKGVEAVIGLGDRAEEAWEYWKKSLRGGQVEIPFVKITHPTQPESSSKGDKAKLAEATRVMLRGWNTAIERLRATVRHPDSDQRGELYGDGFRDGDKAPIPAFDLPAGLPAWMKDTDGWARRVGTTDAAKRANITLKVPKAYLP